MAKPRKVEFHPCTECTLARLMQWNNNPIIAECAIDGDRWVAEYGNPHCVHFKLRRDNAHIEHIKI